MSEIKRVFNCIVPVTSCNFKCHYCYIGQTNDFHYEIKPLQFEIETIVSALSLERMGGSCFFNFCAMGETLLAPYLPLLSQKLIEQGHLVGIVTNGVLEDKINEFCNMSEDLRKNLFFKFSFHYLELLRTKKLQTFCNNIKQVRSAGCSFTIELTVNDETIPYIEEIKRLCNREFGALCHVVESRDNTTTELKRLTKRSYEDHISIWQQFNSPLFSFQQELWGKKQPGFCYAGDWLVNLYLETGDVFTCLGGGRRICNLFEPSVGTPTFTAVGHNCPWAHCYPAYVCLTLGTIPSLSLPHYSFLRNRNCFDGSQWLNETYQVAFGNILKKLNDEYTDDRKDYIDALMAVEYQNPNYVIDKHLLVGILNKYLHMNDIRSVAILGLNDKQLWLCNLLKESNVRVKFVADDRYEITHTNNIKERLKRILKYFIKRIIQPSKNPIVNLNDYWPHVDILIVSDFSNYLKYKNVIHQSKKAVNVMSITELVQ